MFQAVATLSLIDAGEAAWGDYDNDNDLDLLVTGLLAPSGEWGEFITQLWINVGNDQFTLDTNLGVQYFGFGSVAWVDYDLDSDLDFVVTGLIEVDYLGGTPLTELWINQGNEKFTQYRAPLLPDVMGGSVNWGDYDNDGDLDLLITGLRASQVSRTPIWTNQGNGKFTQLQGTTIPMVYSVSDAEWGDYDNDGDLDFAQGGMLFDPLRSSSEAQVTKFGRIKAAGISRCLKLQCLGA